MTAAAGDTLSHMVKLLTRSFPKPHVLLVLGVLLFGATFSAAAYIPDPTPKIDVTDTDETGAATLILKTKVSGADVYLNKIFIGRTPHVQTGLPPGVHVLRFELDGYRPRELVLDLQEKRTYTIEVTLVRRTGWLSLSSIPPDASFYIDGESTLGTTIEVPTGDHVVRAYRFGYREAVRNVYVPVDGIVSARFELEPAPFEVSELRLRKPAFNPSNAGSLGTAVIAFSVTSFGRADVEIRDASGRTVWTASLPPFTESRQSVSWDGRDGRGESLPDGEYSVVVRAFPNDGTGTAGEEGLERSATVAIDSSVLIAPRTLSGAVSGLDLYPDSFVDPAQTLRFSARWKPVLSSTGSLDRSSLVFGTQIALGGAYEIALQSALDPDSSGSWSAGAGVKRTLFGSGLFRSAAYLEAAFSSGEISEDPSSPSPLRGGFSASLGTQRLFGGLALEIEVPTWEDPTPRLNARMGVSLTDGRKSAGFSAVLRTDSLDERFALARSVSIAAEGGIFLSPLPLVFNLSLGTDFGSGGLGAIRPSLGLSLIF